MKDTSPYTHYGPFGGQEGTAFRIVCEGFPDALHFRSSDRINALQLSYTDRDNREDSTEKAGGNEGVLCHFYLMPGERITHFSLAAGQFVEAVTIDTDRGRHARFGNEQSIINHICVIPEAEHVVGFFGRCSQQVDALGILCMPGYEDAEGAFGFIPGLA